jgi:hypothetical protein
MGYRRIKGMRRKIMNTRKKAFKFIKSIMPGDILITLGAVLFFLVVMLALYMLAIGIYRPHL